VNFSKGVGQQQSQYIAHALDYRETVRKALQITSGHKWVAIFEDDILLTTSVSLAARRLRKALDTAPEDADLIYLEWCFDDCARAQYQDGNVWISKAPSPFCSAAIVYSEKGLSRLLHLLSPIVSAIDDMLSEFCRQSSLECYKLRLPCFAQDRFWGSDRSGSMIEDWARSPFHELYTSIPLCRDAMVQPALKRVLF